MYVHINYCHCEQCLFTVVAFISLTVITDHLNGKKVVNNVNELEV